MKVGNIVDNNKAGLCLIIGVFLSLMLSVNYTNIETSEEFLGQALFLDKELSDIPIYIRELSKLPVYFDGYGILHVFAAFTLAIFMYITWSNICAGKEKNDKLLVVISGIFGIANVSGLCMYEAGGFFFDTGVSWILVLVGAALAWGLLFYLVAYWALKGIDSLFLSKKIGVNARNRFTDYMENHLFIISFLLIMAGWLFWLYAYYPASMDFDVYRQLNSYLGIWEHSNHDPWFSSCVLGWCYKIGAYICNENMGIFIYVLFRDIILAVIYASCVVRLKDAGIRREIYYIVLAFYSLTPVWGAYAKHAFKDTFCAGLFCWFVLETIMLVLESKRSDVSYKSVWRYGLSALFTALFRNNCIYAVFPVSVLIVFYFGIKKICWKYTVVILLCVSTYFCYNYIIINYGGIRPADTKEALSIPFQQTARTVKMHGEDITEQERAAIDACLDYNSMAEEYDPLISDPIKNKYKYPAQSAVKEYVITWFTMFFKYPVTYIEAAVGQSYGYYAFTPKQPYWAGNWNSGMTIFDWIEVEGFQDTYSFHYMDNRESMRQALDLWADLWDQIPVLNLTDTLAFYTWGIVLIGVWLVRKKYWEGLIPVLSLLIMILTCMASPVNDCFRYYASVAASAPALLILVGNERKEVSE